MVRYLFDAPAELERHVRLAGGSFFLPCAKLPGGRGSRVAVEIAFSRESDRPLLHGRVLSRSREGVFIEAPSARATARWLPGPDAPRRLHRRFPCDLFVEVQPPHADPWLCRALDLGEGGLRLATGSFETGVEGDQVALTLVSPELDLAAVALRARLCWAGTREAGLQLLEPPPLLAALLQRLESSHQESIELIHSESCACRGGVAIGQRQP